MPEFSYIGQPMTGPEFVAYVAAYDFGPIVPDQIVIHNSANPDASWAPLNADPKIKWDRSEMGLTEFQIRSKRRLQLDAIMRYYRDTNGWDAGPHLFFDDRWIWLFTPMDTIGIHAKEGNSYRDASGKLHYSLGWETIGWFGKVGWPAPMQGLLRTAAQALCKRLPIEIVYKPAPLHQPTAHQNSIAFHRDYNKAECPGAVITPEYAIPILAAPVSTFYTFPGLPVYRSSMLIGEIAVHLPDGAQVEVDQIGGNDYAAFAGHVKRAVYPDATGQRILLEPGFVDTRLLKHT